MHFAHPAFFYIFLGLIFILPAAAWWLRHLRQKDLRAFGRPDLVARLMGHVSPGRLRLQSLALMAGILLLVLALAGPQYGVQLTEVRRQGVDVMVALDVSKSMLAEDVKPSRLERAKLELGALIDRLKGDRVGVLAFAGSAQLACPLTTDYSAAKMFLNYTSPESVPRPGTALGEAIRAAIRAYPKGGEGYRALVLLTDGEDHGSHPAEAAREAKAAGVRIMTIGFGSPQGEPIPLRQAGGSVSGYVKNSSGKTVVSRLDEATLRQIAEITGGLYIPAHQGTLESEAVAARISGLEKREVSAGRYGVRENRYQWALVPALLLLLLALWLPSRKGAWLLIGLFSLVLSAPPALAGTADDVNAGNRVYRQKQYDQALKKYRDAQITSPDEPVVDYNLGNALQKKSEYAEAEKAYRRALRSSDRRFKSRVHYNLGNNFFKQKKYAEAAKEYRQALRFKPRDEDSLYNLAQALAMARQEAAKPPSDKEQSKEDKKQDPSAKPKPGSQSEPGQGEKSVAQDDKDSQGQDQKAGRTDQPKSGPDDKGEQAAGSQARQTTPDDQKTTRMPQPGEMQPEEAENLLDAVQEAERAAQQERQRRQAQRRTSGGGEEW